MKRGALKRLIPRPGPSRRRGAAMVEFAIVLPVLLTFLFGIIEFGHLFNVRLSAQQAAREGCRLAVLQTTSKPYNSPGSLVMSRMTDIIEASGMSMSDVTVAIQEDTPADPMVTITITIPYSAVALTGFLAPITTDVTATSSMRKEGA